MGGKIKRQAWIVMVYAITIFVIFLWISSVIIHFTGSQSDRVLLIRNNLFTIIPQGWSFFTRNPREPQIYIYQKEHVISLIRQNNFADENFFGLRHNMTARQIETDIVLSQIENKRWQKLKGDISFVDMYSIFDTMHPYCVTNESYAKTLCDTIIFQVQQVTPYNWFLKKPSIYMPSIALKVFVECQ